MQLTELLCCLVLTITVTSTCAKAGEPRRRELALTRKLKRDAALLIDNFPIESIHNHKPKVIYRRVSRQKYGPPKPKPKYGVPKPKYGLPRPKHAAPPKPRKPTKKFRKQISSAKYGPPIHDRRTPKPKYVLKHPTPKPQYGPPKKVPTHYQNHEPAGFAEPPTAYEHHHPPNVQQNYGEPPVDSYGAPLKAPLDEPYPTAESYDEDPSLFGNYGFSDFGRESQTSQNNFASEQYDNSYAYSKKRPVFVKHDELFDSHQNPNQEDDTPLHSYSDVISYNHNYPEPQFLHNRNKKPQYFVDRNKKVNKYWKSPRYREESNQVVEDEVLVGGQYAEPPPRYVPKFQPSAPMFNGGDDFAPPMNFADSKVAASATISPYVNYKHSNMAFSPQNLNDAFSIVDK